MKCSVCGNELEPNSTKCGVCGSINHKDSNLKSAMSNISALASALKNEREVKEQQKAYIKDMKKVSTVDEGIDELYKHDIEFIDNDADLEEEFDLNAFYENAKLFKEEVKEDANVSIKEEPKEVKNEDLILQNKEEVIPQKEEEEEITFKYDEDDIQNTESDNEDLDDIVIEDHEAKKEELIVEEGNLVKDVTQENYEKVDKLPEIEESITKEDEQSDEEDEESGILIQFDTPIETSTNDNYGYIKEDEIQAFGEDQNNNEEFNIETPEVKEQSSSEDNSEFVNLENDATDNMVQEEKIEEFNPVKADDVPYTQLEEDANSKVSDDHPIKIDSKDVVGADIGSKDTSSFVEENTSKQKEKKGNKFFGVLAIITFIATIIAFGLVMVYVHLIEGAITTNAVFDFISEIMTGDVFMYVVLGSLGGCIVTLLFSIFQIFSRPRKMGKVMLILSLLLVIGVGVAYYFSDELLLFAWDYFKSLIGM